MRAGIDERITEREYRGVFGYREIRMIVDIMDNPGTVAGAQVNLGVQCVERADIVSKADAVALERDMAIGLLRRQSQGGTDRSPQSSDTACAEINGVGKFGSQVLHVESDSQR